MTDTLWLLLLRGRERNFLLGSMFIMSIEESSLQLLFPSNPIIDFQTRVLSPSLSVTKTILCIYVYKTTLWLHSQTTSPHLTVSQKEDCK